MKNTTFSALLFNLGFSLLFCSTTYANTTTPPTPTTTATIAAPTTTPNTTPNLNNNTLPLLAVSAPRPLTVPTAPTLNVKGYILLDANSGKILASQNPDTRLAPASLTKMMTAYLVSSALQQGRLHLDDKAYISEKAWRTGGSKMFVKVGDYVSLRDLLQGIVVDSGNDACIAVAEHLAGSEDAFVNLMNQQAALLGMTGTHYTDSTGMPNENHYTTARDMGTLARAIVFNYPNEYKLYSQKWFSFNNIKQPNRNRLLWRDDAVDGIKTGHTDEAGFCLASSAYKNNMRLIAVVLGAPSDKVRADDSQTLLNYGFRFFETKPLFTAQKPIQSIRVWLGKNKLLPIGVAQDLYVTVPAGQFRNLKTEFVIPDALTAPIAKNQKIGDIKVVLNNQVLLTQPIIALQDNPKANILTRFRDRTHLMLQKMFGKKTQFVTV